MGKFSYVASPGLQLICKPFQMMHMVSIRVQQLDVKTVTQTKDNVTVAVKVSIQYSVDPEQIQSFYFKLSDPSIQISSHVESTVRSHIPNMDLGSVYSTKLSLASEMNKDLVESMSLYGILIHHCLITDIAPDRKVLDALNQLNIAARQREANLHNAEAIKLAAVKAAEARAESELLAADAAARAAVRVAEGEAAASLLRAEGDARAAVLQAEAAAEARRLAGAGVANLRAASGLGSSAAVHLLLTRQHLAAMRAFSARGGGAIVLPHGPAAITDIEVQVPRRACTLS